MLGIDKIIPLKNARVDAATTLEDGRLILIEIKYTLDWRNCCNARIEIQRFLTEKLYRDKNFKNNKPEWALIIFEHFSRDWSRKMKGIGTKMDGISLPRRKPNPTRLHQIQTHTITSSFSKALKTLSLSSLKLGLQ
ncbi:MAG: hypothetical protein RMJ15_03740 [Nitrososphaerota archaeon]|nr:hypothetical protein [Candidatus Bathyarchaeota archaeon]MDW8022837.1 hypothetical protein [Nitrososphaerota archaeon]